MREGMAIGLMCLMPAAMAAHLPGRLLPRWRSGWPVVDAAAECAARFGWACAAGLFWLNFVVSWDPAGMGSMLTGAAAGALYKPKGR